MAETISEPFYGVCLTCRINFSLRAEAVKNPLSLLFLFFLNLMFTSPDAQVFLLITAIISFRAPKSWFVNLLPDGILWGLSGTDAFPVLLRVLQLEMNSYG